MRNQILSATALALIGCTVSPESAEEPSELVGEKQSELLGAVINGSDCSATDKSFLAKAMHYGRTVAVSNAFRECMSAAMARPVSGVGGPYMQCKDDPYYGYAGDHQLTRVLAAARSTVDVKINCTGGTGNASAGISPSYGQLTAETLSFSNWLQVHQTLAWPVCNGSNGPNCRYAAEPWPWSQAAGIIWHEAMHQQHYTHGANEQEAAKTNCGYSDLSDSQWDFQRNTMPYLVGNCMSEVISRSGRICGAPLETGTGLNLITSFDGSACTEARDPQSATVTWQYMGAPLVADKIAACGGRIYALNYDKTLWVSGAGGADGSWTYVTRPNSAEQIFCAQNRLYALNADRTLWRNAGSDLAVNWTYVGKPGNARQITGGGTTWMYALNWDSTLWESPSGADGSFRWVGRPGAADRIAVGVSNDAFVPEAEGRLFALNYDKTLWFNHGDGCDMYWHQIERSSTSRTVEIAAADRFTIYAIDSDPSGRRTLWRGKINGSEWMSAAAFGRRRLCDGSKLVPY